jgi:hypothetical protein
VIPCSPVSASFHSGTQDALNQLVAILPQVMIMDITRILQPVNNFITASQRLLQIGSMDLFSSRFNIPLDNF